MNAVRKVVSALLATAMVAILTFATVIPVNAHYPSAVIQSEWADAAMVDLQAADPTNEIEAYVYFKNDGDYLYALVDVADDTTEDGDESTLSFDTGHDTTYTDGHGDTFSWYFDEFDHRIWDSTADDYVLCRHFDPSPPPHTGLAVDRGFGTSPNSGINHVMYEYRIPLPLILATGSAQPAEFSATPTTGPTPLEVQFTDDFVCDFNSWSWDFVDGGTSNEQNLVHIYTTPGPFTVSLISSGGSCQNRTAAEVDYIHPYTMGVGGEAYPLNEVSLTAPWLGLALLLASGGILVVRRRRAV